MTKAEFKQHLQTLIKISGEDKAFLKICKTSHNFLKEKSIYNINANDFAELSGLDKNLSLKILLKINTIYYNK